MKALEPFTPQCLQATRKKPPPMPTAPCAPQRAHRRRSDDSCGTKPPVEIRPPPALSGHALRRQGPGRTNPTAPAWFAVTLTPTTAFGAQIRDVGVPPVMSLQSASASQTKKGSCPDQPQGRYIGGPALRTPPPGRAPVPSAQARRTTLCCTRVRSCPSAQSGDLLGNG